MAFLEKISSKDNHFKKICAFSESAQWADLKNGLIFFIAINFGYCKQTADRTEISKIKCCVIFNVFYVWKLAMGLKIFFLHCKAIFSAIKGFTKTAVARPIGFTSPQIQLLGILLGLADQNIPCIGPKVPGIIQQRLLKMPYFSTLNLSRGHYGLRRPKIFVGDYEGLLMKGSR